MSFRFFSLAFLPRSPRFLPSQFLLPLRNNSTLSPLPPLPSSPSPSSSSPSSRPLRDITYDDLYNFANIADLKSIHDFLNKVEHYGWARHRAINLKTLNRILHILKNQPTETLTYLFNRMKMFSVVPDIITYSIILEAAASRKELKKVEELWNEMIALNIKPNVYTYSSLIKMYDSMGDTKRVVELWSQMKENGVAMNDVFYGMLVSMFAKSNYPPEYLPNLFQEMEKGGSRPTAITFTNLFARFGVKDNEHAANVMVKCIEDSGIKPDMYLYSTMLETYIKRGDFAKIKKLKEEMAQNGIKPNPVVYQMLLLNSAKHETIKEVLDIFAEMKQRKIRPSHVSFSLLLQHYGGLADAAAVDKILEVLQDTSLILSVFQYAKIFTKTKDTNIINKIRKEMKRSGVDCKICVYNVLINTFGEKHDMYSVSLLIKEMKASGIVPDIITYTTLIKFYVKLHDFETANKLMVEMRKNQLPPTTIAYNIFLHAYLKKGDVPAIHATLNEMENLRVPINDISRSILGTHYDQWERAKKQNAPPS